VPKAVSNPVTSELNKLPQPSGNVSSTAGSYSQSQQQVMSSQSIESLSSSGRPDGSSAVGAKSSGFMSKIFGKPKDTQEDMHRKSGLDVSLNV
jgi:hypothetical protein